MRAAVALVLAASMSMTACFPHDARKRTLAKVTEGGLVVGGIVMLGVVNSGADCDENGPGLDPNEDCEDRAKLLGNIGFGLILVGLIGFIVTVSTSPDDNATTAPNASKTPDQTTMPTGQPQPLPDSKPSMSPNEPTSASPVPSSSPTPATP